MTISDNHSKEEGNYDVVEMKKLQHPEPKHDAASRSLVSSMDLVLGAAIVLSAIVFLMASIAAPQLITLLNLQSILNILRENISAFKIRFDDVAQIDQKWADQYFLIFLLFPISSVTTFMLLVTVVMRHASGDKPAIIIGWRLIRLLAGGVAFCAFIFYILFLRDFSLHTSDYPGIKRVFFNRTFPFIAAVCAPAFGLQLAQIATIITRSIRQRWRS